MTKKELLDNGMEITFTWIDAEEIPSDVHEPVLYLTTNNKLGTFKDTETFSGSGLSHWESLRRKYHVKCWVYQKDVVLKD